jgi:micrococcal nuclease
MTVLSISTCVALGFSAALLAGCPSVESRCGPTKGVVARVIDGDTIELESGETIRYLMVDTPETFGGEECYGPEAKQFNTDIALGEEVTLKYDTECTDRFDRTLAYVSVGDREINALLIERGFACVLYIPPNGADRRTELESLEEIAQQQDRGLWGACTSNPC